MVRNIQKRSTHLHFRLNVILVSMKKTSLYVNSISETNNSTILSPIALDCEMVGVGPENSNALGRISIVGYAGEVLCNITVKPEGEICDYRTSWSGLREEDMLHAMPYPYVRKQVESIMHNRIVVGHMLENDFAVLNVKHPPHLVRDTGKVPYPKLLAGFPIQIHIGLRALTLRLFGISIQNAEHCSIEDARASMAIYRLVKNMWEADLLKTSQ
ncbi:RNA exonuclease 4 [Schistosoma japonicum]|nr:RNA exonuclease 4 [Schistosoma japonicum]